MSSDGLWWGLFVLKYLGFSESTVSENIESLKEKGVLKRIGGTRGYWKVNHK